MFSVGEDWILWSKWMEEKIIHELYDHELQMSSN